MNQSTIDAKILFARNCVHGAERADLYGERGMAAELRASAREALSGIGAAVAPGEPLDPSQSRAQAIAAAMMRALH